MARLPRVAVLLALASSAEPLEVRVRFGDEPAPPGTEVRLFEPSPLCGTLQRCTAPRRTPGAEGRVTFENASAQASVVAEHPALGLARSGAVGGAGPVTLTCPAGGRITGVALDDLGRLATEAMVALVPTAPAAGGGVAIESNVGTRHHAV